MSRGREYTRLELRKIIDQATGLHQTPIWSLPAHQSRTSIGNKHMLPVRVLSVLGFPPPAQLQTPSGAFAFLEGYSAVAGTSEAAPDATGRGGDTHVVMRATASAGSRGSASLHVLTPMTASGSAGASGTATLHVV
jgi:hypothetical protein